MPANVHRTSSPRINQSRVEIVISREQAGNRTRRPTDNLWLLMHTQTLEFLVIRIETV